MQGHRLRGLRDGTSGLVAMPASISKAPRPQRMAWPRLLDNTRLGGRAAAPTDGGRSEYQKDHDRLIFSEPFRKLSRKTQVHPLPENDRVHNRLTHTLEVSCVGRSLGELTGKRLAAAGELPPHVAAADVAAVVQAACLAHDIGNPPFGHAGEYAVRDWYSRRPIGFFSGCTPAAVQDFKTFEGNAQGFRLLTSLVDTVGLRLTYATLASFIKYPWSSVHAPRHRPGKFNYFDSERAIFTEICGKLGIVEHEAGVFARHPLVYLVEAADDICYAIIDIEDGIEMGILPPADVEALLCDLLTAPLQAEFRGAASSLTDNQRIRWLRGKAVDLLIEDCVQSFFSHAEAILCGRFASTLVEAGAPRVAQGIRAAKQMARDRIFTHSRKMEIEIGAYAAIDTLLDACSDSVRELLEVGNRDKLSYRASRVLTLMGEHAPPPGTPIEESYRLMNDFVSGLTDNRATRLAQAIRGAGG
ncbi:deoxyguanosinetriphosphate triphosphohydrolase [Rhizosaccharibacter radicis]|uniref:Deoxyguanosinetriphosphate triphosphohydrolase n=1 Tax=Rhizosaccharibacter radicis TaxID=2782605 RepID=A0ABT1W057_9PROT|nr:deoxyguanosinetriphosphate triphosphohydrolase [Acetobacteraceae bacterium KSS12]